MSSHDPNEQLRCSCCLEPVTVQSWEDQRTGGAILSMRCHSRRYEQMISREALFDTYLTLDYIWQERRQRGLRALSEDCPYRARLRTLQATPLIEYDLTELQRQFRDIFGHPPVPIPDAARPMPAKPPEPKPPAPIPFGKPTVRKIIK